MNRLKPPVCGYTVFRMIHLTRKKCTIKNVLERNTCICVVSRVSAKSEVSKVIISDTLLHELNCCNATLHGVCASIGNT